MLRLNIFTLVTIFTILIFVNPNYSQHIDSTKVIKSRTRIKVN
jgi:hypothetical protein